MELTRLFTPITINGLTMKNRIVMSALHHLYTPDGYATPRFNEYYWRRARGGAGLIMAGGCRYDDFGGARSMMSLQTDEFIPGYREFTDGMHARGAKVGVQLYHAGRYAHQIAIPGGQKAIAPSAVYSKYTRETPRAMTVEELKGIIRNCAAAAVRAKEAGFDLVEVVGSAGYLVTQFLSPLTNLRTDEYGGSWENRTRFARELTAALRAAVGADYPLGMRIAGNDFMPGSNTNVEAVEFCKMMETAGIDILNVTGGWHETVVPQLSGDLPAGGYTYLAAAVKDAVHIPVAASNRINHPLLAEKILAIGEADMISMGRPLVADPDWPKKAQMGKFDEIRNCVACNQGCLAKTFFGKPIECLVNASAGREYLLTEIKPDKLLKILVLGAGPAGCEFAVQASARGHQVTVWEKEKKIGGQLDMVAAPPGKGEFKNLIRYYDAMLRENGVEVVLNKDAAAEEIAAYQWDAVVTATGITPNRLPFLEGAPIPVVTAYDVLQRQTVPGRDILIVGGGAVGCETAQYLAHEAALSPEQVYFLMEHKAESLEWITQAMNKSRRNITVIDIIKIGAGFEPGTGWPVFKDLKRLGVKQLSFTKIKTVNSHRVVLEITDQATQAVAEMEIPCDTLIMAVGAKSNHELYDQLKAMDVKVYNLGDSSKVGKVLDAVRDACDLAVDLGR